MTVDFYESYYELLSPQFKKKKKNKIIFLKKKKKKKKYNKKIRDQVIDVLASGACFMTASSSLFPRNFDMDSSEKAFPFFIVWFKACKFFLLKTDPVVRNVNNGKKGFFGFATYLSPF